MHSRIFQVSKSPIEPDQYATPFAIPDYFQTGVADYVVEVDDREDELGYFMESFAGIFEPGPEKDSFCVTNEGRERYFKDRYRRFRELTALMLTMSLEAFIGTERGPEGKPISQLIYELNEAYSDKYGYNIYEDDELEPLCDWLRNADLSAVYYFGNVLDYHF